MDPVEGALPLTVRRAGRSRPRKRLSLLLALLAIPSAAHAECIDYRLYSYRTIDVSGWATSMAGTETTLCAVGGAPVFHVIDNRDPLRHEVVASVDMPFDVIGLGMEGRYAYIGSYGLYVVDLLDPASPVIMGSAGTSWFKEIRIVDGRAYAATAGEGLRIVDVSDPAHPVVEGLFTVPNPYWVFDVAVALPFAFLASEQGVHVIDVSDPTAPVLVSEIFSPGEVHHIAVAGQTVYTTTWNELVVIDVSDPASPAIVGSMDEVIGPGDIVPADGYVWIPTWASVLLKVDVSDPSAPYVSGSWEAPSGGDLVLIGSDAYVGGIDVINVVDLSPHPLPSPIVGSIPLAGAPRRVATSGPLAFVGTADQSSGAGRLQVIDLSNPKVPVALGEAAAPAQVTDVVAEGSRVYLSTGSAGLQIVDVSEPDAPVITGSVGTQGHVFALARSGSHAYLAAAPGGLEVVDVSDPAAPASVAFLPTSAWPRSVAASGHFVYLGEEVGGSSGRLEVIDVFEPTAPVRVGSVDVPDIPYAIEVSGNIVLAAQSHWLGRGGRIQSIDVSDPTSPVVVGQDGTRGPARGLAVGHGLAYVVGEDWGLQVVDVAGPDSPAVLAKMPHPDGYHDAAMMDRYVCVVADDELRVLPVHCVEGPVPVLLSGFTAEPVDRAVELSWFTSFENRHDGFLVYRGETRDAGYRLISGGLVRGTNAYRFLDTGVAPATTYYYRLGAVDFDGNETMYGPAAATTGLWGQPTSLRAAHPSPFRATTSIAFALASAARTRLAVYDVAGRRVRTLLDGERMEDGAHESVWDGRDDSGLRVGGGTYFVRLTASDVTTTTKVVFLGGR